MTDKSQTANERRERQRFGISAPLTVIIGKRAIPGFTQNLSNRGVFFHLDLADSAMIGGNFEFRVELPPEITLSTRCLVECQGRVVRTEKVSGQMTGIAAEILHYSIQREPSLRLEFAHAEDAMIGEPALPHVHEPVIALRISGQQKEARVDEIANRVIYHSLHDFAIEKLQPHPDPVDDGRTGIEIQMLVIRVPFKAIYIENSLDIFG
jgi:hypothetical protein